MSWWLPLSCEESGIVGLGVLVKGDELLVQRGVWNGEARVDGLGLRLGLLGRVGCRDRSVLPERGGNEVGERGNFLGVSVDAATRQMLLDALTVCPANGEQSDHKE
jgi:hypothetical protein